MFLKNDKTNTLKRILIPKEFFDTRLHGSGTSPEMILPHFYRTLQVCSVATLSNVLVTNVSNTPRSTSPHQQPYGLQPLPSRANRCRIKAEIADRERCVQDLSVWSSDELTDQTFHFKEINQFTLVGLGLFCMLWPPQFQLRRI